MAGRLAVLAVLVGALAVVGQTMPDRRPPSQDPKPERDDRRTDRDPTAAKDPEIQLDPPTADALFRVEAEAAALERIRREAEARGIRVAFPTSAVPPRDAQRLPARPHAAHAAFVSVPICHDPLYFEERSVERYGWHVHGLQPAISTLHFYLNFLALPYQVLRRPPCSTECANGLPLPGDPVPYAWHLSSASTGLAICYDPGFFDFRFTGFDF